MTTRDQVIQRQAIEAKALAKVSKKTRKLFAHRLGLTALQQRESNRVLYGVLEQLREEGCSEKAMAKGLGVSMQRVLKLRQEPPSEEELAAAEAAYTAMVDEREARRRAEAEAWRKAMEPEWERERQEAKIVRDALAADKKRQDEDEAWELRGQSLHCLIECLTDYAPQHERTIFNDQGNAP